MPKSLLLPLLLLLSLVACGERVPQSSACAEIVDCFAARDAARGVTTDFARFEEDGACWSSEEGAALCDTSCVNGLELLRTRYDDLPGECQP